MGSTIAPKFKIIEASPSLYRSRSNGKLGCKPYVVHGFAVCEVIVFISDLSMVKLPRTWLYSAFRSPPMQPLWGITMLCVSAPPFSSIIMMALYGRPSEISSTLGARVAACKRTRLVVWNSDDTMIKI